LRARARSSTRQRTWVLRRYSMPTCFSKPRLLRRAQPTPQPTTTHSLNVRSAVSFHFTHIHIKFLSSVPVRPPPPSSSLLLPQTRSPPHRALPLFRRVAPNECNPLHEILVCPFLQPASLEVDCAILSPCRVTRRKWCCGVACVCVWAVCLQMYVCVGVCVSECASK
jgi:hypothetical protein